jgi:hypothetical protein
LTTRRQATLKEIRKFSNYFITSTVIHETKARRVNDLTDLYTDKEDPIDAQEIFDYIRDINDPEHPYTLEQLNVVQVCCHIKRCSMVKKYLRKS